MRSYLTIMGAAVLLILPRDASAQNPKPAPPEAMTHASPATLKWAPIRPEGFAPGMEMAVLSGDPHAAGQPFVIRVRFKDGYLIPAHYHPTTENITVLQGTFMLKMGNTAAANMDSYAPGDFISVPPLQPHHGGARGETVVQVHGVGPFEIKLAKPGARK
jgi:quercetin dioxygenase-like cupin family protein